MKLKNNSPLKYFHNPRCSKSRQGLKLLEEKNVALEIIDYIKTGISQKDAEAIVTRYSGVKTDLIRKKEASEEGVTVSNAMKDTDIIHTLSTYPRLLERPILLSATAARLGRPPELLLG